jgi:hypothetical protein
MYGDDLIRVVERLSDNIKTNRTINKLLEYSDITDPQQIDGSPDIQIYSIII